MDMETWLLTEDIRVRQSRGIGPGGMVMHHKLAIPGRQLM